jgi:type I restriction enzyme, S subunit
MVRIEQIANLPIIIADGNYSSKYPRSDEFIENGVPFIRANNFKNNSVDDLDLLFISEQKHSELRKGHLIEGDVLITTRGNIGNTAIVPKRHDNSNINAQIVLLRPDDTINNVYLMYCFKTDFVKKQIFAHTTGTALKQLPVGNLRKIKIPIPPLTDQLHIANILNQAENLIARRKESIRLLDEFLKSTFLEMFGDPVRNDSRWEQVLLSKLGSLDRGVSKNRPRNSPELLGGEYPLIQTGDIANAGLYINKYNQTYSELGMLQSRMWKKGTLCITIAANIGKTSILNFDSCFPDSIVGFKTNVKEANTIFVYFLFSFLQKILEKNAPQAAQKNINLEILRNLPVPKPPIALQTQFAQIVESTEVIKAQYQSSLQELERLYGSLSQRAFKGDLRVKDGEVMMAAEAVVKYQNK